MKNSRPCYRTFTFGYFRNGGTNYCRNGKRTWQSFGNFLSFLNPSGTFWNHYGSCSSCFFRSRRN